MKTMQIRLQKIYERLAEAGIDTPELDARLLLQEALGIKHEDIIMNNHYPKVKN
jgi:hypothetical protein